MSSYFYSPTSMSECPVPAIDLSHTLKNTTDTTDTTDTSNTTPLSPPLLHTPQVEMSDERVLNMLRYCLFDYEIIAKHIFNWMKKKYPNVLIDKIEVFPPVAGGLFDIYYQLFITSGENILSLRCFIHTVVKIKEDWLSVLNQMLFRREKTFCVQQANETILKQGGKIPVQLCPYPYCTIASSNQVIDLYILFANDIYEEPYGFDSSKIIKTFNDRDIILIKYDSTLTISV